MFDEIDRGEEAAVRRFLSDPTVSVLVRRAEAAAGDPSSAVTWVLWRLSLGRPEDVAARVALREAFWDAGLQDWLRANGHAEAARSRAVPDEVLAAWAGELSSGL